MVTPARRLADIRGFGIDEMARAADRPPTAGPTRRVLRMENLDTNLPLPPGVVEATADSLATPLANSWLPFTGDDDLRAAIAAHTERRTGHAYDPLTEIVVTCGGAAGVLNVLLAVVDPGDEVVLTDPMYAGLVNRIRLAGGKPVFVPFRYEHDEWRLDLDRLAGAVGPATKALLVMSPCMPHGAVLNEAEWEAVCSLCRDRDLLLIYDAAMEAILFDDRPLLHPLRFDGMGERTAVVGSLSKEHRMIGWRVGWVAGPRDLIRDVGWTHIYNNITPVGIARVGATTALSGDQANVADTNAELQRRRDVLLDVLDGWPVRRPGGGWSLLLDASEADLSSTEVSRLLLEECGIAATPMVGWGDEVGARHVRLVFSNEGTEELRGIAERVAGTTLAAALTGGKPTPG